MPKFKVVLYDCPLGEDPRNDCNGCMYSGDYHYEGGECVPREDEEDSSGADMHTTDGPAMQEE